MPTNTLRIGSISAERLSGVSPNSISEQCKVTIRPVNISAGRWEESYNLSGFDYVNGTGVIGETLNPEVDHTMVNGVFLISPDQTNGILSALARVHKDEDEHLEKIEITLPYTIDDTVAKIESVKVHATENVPERMDNMVGPHQIITDNVLPSEVCQAFDTQTEVTTAEVTIPDAYTASPALTIDITEYMKAEPSSNLAIALYLEVEVVDVTGNGPDDDTKAIFDGSQAGILFQYSQEPRMLPVLDINVKDYKAHTAFDDASSGIILSFNRNTEVLHLGLSYTLDCRDIKPPFFRKEFQEIHDVSAEIVYPKTRGKAPSAYFTGSNSGTTASVASGDVASWTSATSGQPGVTRDKAEGLTVLDLTDAGYDPATATFRYETNMPQLYSATGRPKAVGVDTVGTKTITTILLATDSPEPDEYGTQTVSINLA